MERISTMRKRIDEIDKRLLFCLKERVETCKEIGAVKNEHGIAIRDSRRENKVYANVMKTASELKLDPQGVKNVYREIISLCTSVEANTQS